MKYEQATCQPYSQAKNVDKGKHPVFVNISEGNLKIVTEHIRRENRLNQVKNIYEWFILEVSTLMIKGVIRILEVLLCTLWISVSRCRTADKLLIGFKISHKLLFQIGDRNQMTPCH